MASRLESSAARSIWKCLGRASRFSPLPVRLPDCGPARRDLRPICSSAWSRTSLAVRPAASRPDSGASEASSTVSDDLRGLMRQLGYPVTILTVALGPDQLHGATISSFTSVAMDPDPLVSFSIRIPSRLASHLDGDLRTRFSVYLLDPSPRPTALATLFSRPKDRFASEVFEELEQVCMGRLDCEIFKRVALDDGSRSFGSTIFIGRVLSALNVAKDAKPLMYHNQRYTTIKS